MTKRVRVNEKGVAHGVAQRKGENRAIVVCKLGDEIEVSDSTFAYFMAEGYVDAPDSKPASPAGRRRPTPIEEEF